MTPGSSVEVSIDVVLHIKTDVKESALQPKTDFAEKKRVKNPPHQKR
jgi:hypothetical protein